MGEKGGGVCVIVAADGEGSVAVLAIEALQGITDRTEWTGALQVCLLSCNATGCWQG